MKLKPLSSPNLLPPPSNNTHKHSYVRIKTEAHKYTRTGLPAGPLLETSRMFKFITVTLIFAKGSSSSRRRARAKSTATTTKKDNKNNKSISHSTRSISRICLCACRNFLQKCLKRQIPPPAREMKARRMRTGASTAMRSLCPLVCLCVCVCVCVEHTTCFLCTQRRTQIQLQKCDSKQKFS